MVALKFGVCKNCSHEVVFFDSQWKHHITRTKLYHVPHWPTGHLITLDCKWGCQCSTPVLDESKEQKSKMVLLGSHTDRQGITHALIHRQQDHDHRSVYWNSSPFDRNSWFVLFIFWDSYQKHGNHLPSERISFRFVSCFSDYWLDI